MTPRSTTCSRRTAINAHIAAAEIPRRYVYAPRWHAPKGDWAPLKDLAPEADEEYFPWLLRGSRLVSIIGSPARGKTHMAVALMVETITRRWFTLPDELRFRYLNAPAAFEELSRTRFDNETNFDNIVRYAGMVVFDDLHLVEPRDVSRAVAIIAARCDNALSTVITFTPIWFANHMKSNESFTSRMTDGLVIRL